MKISRVSKIGFVAVIVIALFVWGLNYLKSKDFFKKGNRYYAVYDRIDGLTKSSPVLVNGYKVGVVDDIYFKQDTSAKLVVEIMVGQKYKIPKNSVAEIFSLDLMGSRGIKIIRNEKAKENHKENDTLRSGIEGDLKDQVNMQILPLKRKAEDLISSFDSVMTALKMVFNENTRRNLSKSFESIKNTIVNLEKTTFTLDTIMTAEKSKLAIILANVESITTNIKNNNELFSKMIHNFSAISDSIAKANVVSTFNKADKALGQLNQIVTRINAGEGTIGMLVKNDTLYTNLENATYNLNRLLRDMRENPKRYLHFSAFDIGRSVFIMDPKEALREEQKRIKKEEEEKQKAKGNK
jgi:phospholipid/cholesterol/gamma-HCH transport system substrate-binding protein